MKPPRNPILHGPQAAPEEAPNRDAAELADQQEPDPPETTRTPPRQAGGRGVRNRLLDRDRTTEIVVDLEDIDRPAGELSHASARTRARRRQILLVRDNNAAAALEHFDENTDVAGLMTGRFGLIHMLRHLFRLTGPGHLTVSSWRLYSEDVAHVLKTLQTGRLLSARWLLDHTFQHRQPQEAQQIRETFGRDALRVTRNHAKFLLLGTPDRRWTVTVKTSANLNQNPRLEHFDITNDPALFDFFTLVCDGIFQQEDFSRAKRFPRPAFFRQMSQIAAPREGGRDP